MHDLDITFIVKGHLFPSSINELFLYMEPGSDNLYIQVGILRLSRISKKTRLSSGKVIFPKEITHSENIDKLYSISLTRSCLNKPQLTLFLMNVNGVLHGIISLIKSPVSVNSVTVPRYLQKPRYKIMDISEMILRGYRHF